MKEYIVQAIAQETIDSFDAHNAPELVRCKDCKSFIPYEYNEGKSGKCDAWMASADCDGYCYLAEGR